MRERTVVYLDESGDLGIDPLKGSRYFVVAALATREPMQIRKLVVRSGKRRAGRTKAPELSFHDESDEVRTALLRGLRGMDHLISWEALDKRASDPVGQWHVTYDSICADVLSEMACRLSLEEVRIIVDKFYTSPVRRMEMEDRIRRRVSDRAGIRASDIRISHDSSMNSHGLQACDFVAGSIFQSLERGRSEFYDLISDHVIHCRIRKRCRPWGGV